MHQPPWSVMSNGLGKLQNSDSNDSNFDYCLLLQLVETLKTSQSLGKAQL